MSLLFENPATRETRESLTDEPCWLAVTKHWDSVPVNPHARHSWGRTWPQIGSSCS